MNRERAKELLPIIKAFISGEAIEAQQYDGEWLLLDSLTFTGERKEYRIKPKAPREFWLNPDADTADMCIYEDFDPKNPDYIQVREVLE